MPEPFRGRSPSPFPFALLAVALAVPALAQENLSRGDRRFLEEVEPIMTAQERQIFAEIDRGDRGKFQDLFWARRDPTPTNRRNEAKDQFENWTEQADDQFGRRGQRGSRTDMALVMLLLGPPDNQERVGGRGGGPGGARPPAGATGNNPLQSSGGAPGAGAGPGGGGGGGGFGGPGGGGLKMTYVPNPTRGLPDGLELEFRATQMGLRLVRSDEIEAALERARQRQIAWPSINYARDEDGRLRDLDDLFDPNSPAKQILNALRDGGEPSTDIGLTPDFLFFRSNTNDTYVAAVVEVAGDTIDWSGDTADAQVFYSVEDALGTVIGQAEENVQLQRGENGDAVLELPMQMPPGAYTLRLGLRDTETDSHGSMNLTVEAPDYTGGELVLSSLARFSDGSRVEDFTPVPGRALLVGGFHFIPKVSPEYEAGGDLRVVFNAYGYALDGETAGLTWQITFTKDGEQVLRYNPSPFQLSSPELAIAIVDVPLARLFQDGRREPFEAGSYTAEITVRDTVGGGSVTESVTFEVSGS